MQCQDVAFPLPPWGQPLRGHAVAGPHADQPHRLAELRSAVRGLSPLRPRSPHRLEGGPFSRRREGPFSTCRQQLQIDVDRESRLAGQMGVSAMPTIVFLSGEGRELGRFSGYRDAESFLAETARIAR